jgi:hypothetical protein
MVTEPVVDDETSTAVAEAIAEMTVEAQNNADLQSDVKSTLAQSQTLTQKSMVRSKGVPLPERVLFYRSRGGAEARLPTLQLAYYLSKRHEGGAPVFVKNRLQPLPDFIEDKCEVCVATAGRPKRFRHRFDYVTHMENKHQREWRMMREDEEKLRGPELARVLMAMSPSERAAIRALLGGDGDAPRQEGRTEEQEEIITAACSACGWESEPVANAAALGAAQRSHRCSAEAVVAGGGAE